MHSYRSYSTCFLIFILKHMKIKLEIELKIGFWVFGNLISMQSLVEFECTRLDWNTKHMKNAKRFFDQKKNLLSSLSTPWTSCINALWSLLPKTISHAHCFMIEFGHWKWTYHFSHSFCAFHRFTTLNHAHETSNMKYQKLKQNFNRKPWKKAKSECENT